MYYQFTQCPCSASLQPCSLWPVLPSSPSQLFLAQLLSAGSASSVAQPLIVSAHCHLHHHSLYQPTDAQWMLSTGPCSSFSLHPCQSFEIHVPVTLSLQWPFYGFCSTHQPLPIHIYNELGYKWKRELQSFILLAWWVAWCSSYAVGRPSHSLYTWAQAVWVHLEMQQLQKQLHQYNYYVQTNFTLVLYL